MPRTDVRAKNTSKSAGALASLKIDLDDVDRAPMDVLNQVIWQTAKGGGPMGCRRIVFFAINWSQTNQNARAYFSASQLPQRKFRCRGTLTFRSDVGVIRALVLMIAAAVLANAQCSGACATADCHPFRESTPDSCPHHNSTPHKSTPSGGICQHQQTGIAGPETRSGLSRNALAITPLSPLPDPVSARAFKRAGDQQRVCRTCEPTGHDDLRRLNRSSNLVLRLFLPINSPGTRSAGQRFSSFWLAYRVPERKASNQQTCEKGRT